MIPSRYYVIDERSSYPVQRRGRGRRDDRGNESAITLLPPDPYMIMERPEFGRAPSPTVYRAVPPKSAKNKEASSFVILGDTINTPVQSRPGSPTGRVSPFRGHGFKSPTTTRPNSRVASPSDSPRKTVPTAKSNKSKSGDRPRINRDIGLPPKSPMKSKKIKSSEDKAKSVQSNSKNATSVSALESDKKDGIIENKDEKEIETKKNDGKEEKTMEEKSHLEKKTVEEDLNVEEANSSEGDKILEQDLQKENFQEEEQLEGKEDNQKLNTGSNAKPDPLKDKTNITETKSVVDASKKQKPNVIEGNEKSNSSGKEIKEKVSSTKINTNVREKLTPTPVRDSEDSKVRKSSVSPKPKTKIDKNETNSQQKHSVIKKATKPPLPPKKVGLKSTLKGNETSNEQDKKMLKKEDETKESTKETIIKEKDIIQERVKEKKEETKPEKSNEKLESKKEQEIKKKEDANVDVSLSQKINLGDAELGDVKKAMGNKNSTKSEDSTTKNVSGNVIQVKKTESGEKLIPCFQPDKCQIAPPTMASPSPIITPTISTPSTSAELSSSSIKNSQSIATAPTTVTTSSLSSVSSTVVLTGNLARKEIEHRSRSKETAVGSEVKVVVAEKTDQGAVGVKENNGSAVDVVSDAKVSAEMVKAASKDSVKWSNKENLSGEITSATKVIKAEPDMEVLSPNNLRDSPPRIPPPNLAWDEERIPNGDVPNKVGSESKFRRFMSAIWKFFTYLFCCRCCKKCTNRCCQKSNANESSNPFILSKLNCCKNKSIRCCSNPFKCCCPGCKCSKPKCCEGKKCCNKKTNSKSKPKSKSRKCCAKPSCSCRNCCVKIKNQCSNLRDKLNSSCRLLFCLNMMCCQNFLKKFKFCHKLKCCQKNGCCSCCNPFVKKEQKKLNKKGSHASNRSGDKDQLDAVLVEHTSLMKAAIPVLPICLAVFCLICNLFVPGFGTLISGILCLCFGKPRFSVKDSPKNRFGSFIVNTIIAVAQLFTVVFCLVGWGWSIWWGIIMYKLSRRQKRIKLAEKTQKEAEGSNVNHNHVDVEQG